MDDDTPQDLFVQVGAGFRCYSGMSKNTVSTLLNGLGIADFTFVEQATYETAQASIPPAILS